MARAAIIVRDVSDHWRRKPIFALHIAEGENLGVDSVYSMEYLALAGALQLSANERSLHATGSDAKSILDALPKRKARLQHAHKDHHFLLQSVDNLLHQGAPAPYYVRAHAERRKPKKDGLGRLGKDWTTDDWGNYIADRVACHAIDDLSHEGLNVVMLRITATDLYNSLGSTGQWFVGNTDGSPVGPRGVRDRIDKERMTLYHKERDDYRADRGDSRIWEHETTMKHSSIVFKLKQAPAGQASTITRTIYDKGYHGGNRAKDVSLTPSARASTLKCKLCGMPDSANHWLHEWVFAAVKQIRELVLTNLQQIATAYRTRSTTHKELSFSFLQLLKQTEHPHRIWTANWSMRQLHAFRQGVNESLVRCLTMNDLKKIMLPLERVLAKGALSLWHCKQVNESTMACDIPRPPSTGSESPPTEPGPDDQPDNKPIQPVRRKALPRSERQENRVTFSVPQRTVSMPSLNFPALTDATARQLARSTQSGQSAVSQCLVSLSDTTVANAVPLNGIDFQRLIAVNEGPKRGWISDDTIFAYHLLIQRYCHQRIKMFHVSGARNMIRGEFDRAYMHVVNRRTPGPHLWEYKWAFIPFIIEDSTGKGRHWTLAACDMERRTVKYLDFAKDYSHRSEHLKAVFDFLQNVDVTHREDQCNVLTDWSECRTGLNDMERQDNAMDCGPFICLAADVIASGLPMSVMSCAVVHASRKYIASCLLTNTKPPLAECLCTVNTQQRISHTTATAHLSIAVNTASSITAELPPFYARALLCPMLPELRELYDLHDDDQIAANGDAPGLPPTLTMLDCAYNYKLVASPRPSPAMTTCDMHMQVPCLPNELRQLLRPMIYNQLQVINAITSLSALNIDDIISPTGMSGLALDCLLRLQF